MYANQRMYRFFEKNHQLRYERCISIANNKIDSLESFDAQ